MTFTPRTTAPTDLSTWYGSYNAWNHFSSYGRGNCTWYAYGRTSEIANRNLYNDFHNFGGNGDAKYWIINSWQDYTYTSGSIDIHLGDILIYGSAGGSGHVEVVEAISGNDVMTSYSVYGDTYGTATYFRNRTISMPTWSSTLGTVIDNDGNSHTWGNPFIGYIHNKYLDEPEPPTPPTPSIITRVLPFLKKSRLRLIFARRRYYS